MKILLSEENKIHRIGIETLLYEKGCLVTSALNQTDFLTQLEENIFDCIIFDLDMMSSVALKKAMEIRSNKRNALIKLVGTYQSGFRYLRCDLFDSILHKPLEENKLLKAVGMDIDDEKVLYSAGSFKNFWHNKTRSLIQNQARSA